jgi:transposase-like protein
MAHSDQLRAEAMAALAIGESAHAVARRLGVPRSTIRRWRRDLFTENGPLKKGELGEQVVQLIEDSIATQVTQLRVSRDEAWIRQQSARELAMLHGTIFDRMANLVSAYRPGDEDCKRGS